MDWQVRERPLFDNKPCAFVQLSISAIDRFRSLMGQGLAVPVYSEFDAFGCLRSLRARMALDGVIWV
jgi:hypothetical protein